MKIWKGALTGILLASLIISGVSVYRAYGYGTLVIEMMDPPEGWGPAIHVYIKYTAIMIHRANASEESGWYEVAQEGEINLTKVVDVPLVIGEEPVQAGKYNLIRFNVTSALITIMGGEGPENHTAKVVNGKLNIPIIRGGIQVETGGETHLVIDVTPKITGSPASGYRLVPAAKAIPG